MNEIDIARHSRLIDPHLHVWGWEIPAYLFLGGLAAGVMILTSILWARGDDRSKAVRWAAFAPPLLVSAGMGALFLDLAGKLHVWRFYLAFRWTSPMSWGAWILVLVYPVTLLVALAGLDDAQSERVTTALGRGPVAGLVARARAFGRAHAAGLRRTNLATGVALGVYTGVLLSTLGARALWGSALLGPLFLVSGISTGAALLLLLDLSAEERHLVARWDRIAIGLELFVLALFLVGLATSGADGRSAAELLVGGPYTAPFWALVVIGGLAVPLVLELLEARLHLPPTLAAPGLVLAGGLALRWILVIAGQR
ncbi:MAG TPA: NrfD/PsrC family molybdoenzyme membrane anchor subunit [Anaeromyxobacter sp.]|jgi:formate-dependent nitrite reductase membrane component NrfD|nr:NrfD/PsrC family molybdoenzyme membrane anchor subunit [Anaeromyxobacter sp.]